MKQCPNCGAQIADDSRFCAECGKELPQGTVCPHCGAMIFGGDAFCQNCGKNLKEASTSEPTICKEKQPKSRFKKYLLYFLGAIALLAIIGYFNSNDSKDRDDSPTSAVETTSVDSVATYEVIPITKEKFESILSQLIGPIDSEIALKKVNELFAEEYKKNFKESCDSADKNGCERPRIWWPYSDSDPLNYNIDKLEMSGTNKAKAFVKLSSDLYEGQFEVILSNQNGNWLIDKIITLGIEYVQAYEETSDDYEESLDWLQGHWVYEQGSYRGYFIIQEDKITQYSSMSPERETSTFWVEGDEIVSRIANGVNLTVKIDFANHTIDYGDGCWMHKIE